MKINISLIMTKDQKVLKIGYLVNLMFIGNL